MPDYYKILGIHKNASFDEIKRAYRSKAKSCHPDINKDSDAKLKFQLLNEAYHILSDSDKRNYYDIKINYNNELYRRYGKVHTSHTSESERTTHFKAYAYNTYEEIKIINKIKYFNKVSDVLLFYVMLFIGIIIVIYGINDLFFTKWEGIQNVTGIVFGSSYLALLLYWQYLRKRIKE